MSTNTDLIRSEAENKLLAQLLFPEINKTAEDFQKLYPPRNLAETAKVTRFAPSPTGFVHIGGLFSALISERLAHQSDGIFYLRIEDTDKKREIEGGIAGIVDSLKNFKINNDEGFTNETDEAGNYGSYKQSARIELYKTFAKILVENGKAYPCFCTTEELEALRKTQEDNNVSPGYYGESATHRNKSFSELQEEINSGKPFVIRLNSPGNSSRKVNYKDIIKGNLELPENEQDIVICKSDGLPTYHFAHVVDDHFMGTTHVIRGDEWLPSVPLHLQLFYILGWKIPKYGHIPPILKQEGTSKRKLSKRKDPEAAVSFYHEQGYPPDAVLEYLLNLANSTFEDWRRNNPDKPHSEFPFKSEKIGVSGALFDLIKLTDISKNVVAKFTAREIYDNLIIWAEEFDQDFLKILQSDIEYSIRVFNIDRGGKKPRKDIAKWSDVKDTYSYMFASLFSQSEVYDFPENIANTEIKAILEKYKDIYSASDDKETWLNKIREFSEELGYAKDSKSFKENPEIYKGSLADTTSVIRVAITRRRQSPDIHEIMQVLGEQEVKKRINQAINIL